MQSRVRATVVLVAALLVAAFTGSAAAHYPDHHDAAKLAFGDTLLGSQLDAQTPVSSSAECQNGMAGAYPCKNVDLESFVPLPVLGGATGNDIWGWRDGKSKREFAIIGTSTSTGFVEVTDPKNPKLIGTLPTRGRPDYVLWRDIKVDGHYAFIVSEISRSGLQVFDLRRLLTASTATPTVFTSDAAYDKFSHAHNISINEETDTAYVVGTNTCGVNGENGGLHMVDISKPLEPTFAGCATVNTFSGSEPNNYVHDVECVIYRGPDADYQGREICFGSNEDVVAVYDVTDKSSPRVISTAGYPQATYTHQGALTEDQRWFLFGDELDEQGNGQKTTTYVLDAKDLDALPTPVAFEQGIASIDHNQYVHGNRTYQSNYTAGLRILEFDDASLTAGKLEEVAYFDVVPGVDVAEFAGTWSNYRFPKSGTTVVSAIENEVSGLFVLTPRLGDGPKGGPKGSRD